MVIEKQIMSKYFRFLSAIFFLKLCPITTTATSLVTTLAAKLHIPFKFNELLKFSYNIPTALASPAPQVYTGTLNYNIHVQNNIMGMRFLFSKIKSSLM